MKPASFGARSVAALLDIVIVSVASWILLAPVFKILHFDEREKDIFALQKQMTVDPESINPEMLKQLFVFAFIVMIVLLVILLATHAYYVYFESSASGQTPGKKALGLRVVDLNGQPITRTQALYREMIRWYVDGLFIFPAVIAIFSTPRRQRVGDILAKTMVIEVPRP